MPTLSNYWFEETDFRGNTTYCSIQHWPGLWAWINWANIGSKGSTLVWEREDREVTYDLVALLNNPIVQRIIDDSLGGDASRTSDIKIGWIPWKYVSYYSPRADRDDLTLLLRFTFNFHIGTPWYCSDADGYIEYIIACYLDGSGKLGAYVDGWHYHYDGGDPFCTGEISDRLSRAVPAAIGTLQEQLNSFIALIGDRRFDMFYYLPGSAEKSGSGNTNVDERVSIALLPR